MVERDGLENRCTLLGTEGSNPSLSATKNPCESAGFFVRRGNIMSEVPAPAEQARSWWQRASSGNMSREANNPSLSAEMKKVPQGAFFIFSSASA